MSLLRTNESCAMEETGIRVQGGFCKEAVSAGHGGGRGLAEVARDESRIRVVKTELSRGRRQVLVHWRKVFYHLSYFRFVILVILGAFHRGTEISPGALIKFSDTSTHFPKGQKL